MAKLLDVESDNKVKSRMLQTFFVALAVIAVIIGSFVHNKSAENTVYEDMTENDICVHIKGAVEKMGLYYVPFGTRVNDLGEYAGGFLPNADLDGVNLAAFVSDGEEVYIPFKGDKESGAFNLNEIGEKELIEKIEGIGETYAKKIVSYRESRGGFTSVSELKAVLSEAVYEKVREKFYVE